MVVKLFRPSIEWRWATVPEAALLLILARRTLNVWIDSGRVSHILDRGERLVWLPEVDRFMNRAFCSRRNL